MAAFLKTWRSPCLSILAIVLLILSLKLTCAHDAHHAQDHDHDHAHAHAHDHGHGHAGHANEEGVFPGRGKEDLASVWLMAMGSTLIVSAASFIGLALLPICYGLFGNRMAKEPPEWVLEGMTAFSAAAMLTDAFLHQLPHALAIDDHHHNSGSGLAVIAAILFFFLLDKGMRASAGAGHGHSHGSRQQQQQQQNKAADAVDSIVKGPGEHQAANGSLRKRTAGGEGVRHQGSGGGTGALKEESEEDEQPFLREEETAARRRAMAYLNLVADAVHNFTDGMAIGAAFLRGGSALGWARTIIILAHELPQEIGDYGMLVGSGMTSARALACNFASALSALLGTALVFATGGGASALAENHTSLIEAFTAGGFIYISVGGVMAEMAAKGGAPATAQQLVCMAAGVLLCASLHSDDHSH